MFVIGMLRASLNLDRARTYLEGKGPFTGLLLAAVLGVVTAVLLVQLHPAVHRLRRGRGALTARPMFTRLTRNGVITTTVRSSRSTSSSGAPAPDLAHLTPLRLRGPDGRIPVTGTAAVGEPRLHLVGYGDWTGLASATIIDVGLNARAAVDAIVTDLDKRPSGSS